MRDSKLKCQARDLRTQPTDAEKTLWKHLRGEQLGGWRFRRQHPIPPYIADFACIEGKLVVEVDGGQHADSAYDAARDGHLRLHGWRILRFWNNEVLTNPEGVAETILRELGGPKSPNALPLPNPPPPAAGEGA